MMPPCSVAAWVEEMRGMGDVVLYYKPQGADEDKTGLKREDFLIVLQTPIQAEMQRAKMSVLMQHMALMHTTLS